MKLIPITSIFHPTSHTLHDFQGIKSVYPTFNEYPTFIINYRSMMKEKIRIDEENYLNQRLIELKLEKWQMKYVN